MGDQSRGQSVVEAQLFGRAREQALLRDRLTALSSGSGSLVLVGGEAGIGKTSLAAWLTRVAAHQEIPVFSGACYDLFQAPPYGPWRDVFAALALAANAGDPALPLQRGADLSLVGTPGLASPSRPRRVSRMACSMWWCTLGSPAWSWCVTSARSPLAGGSTRRKRARSARDASGSRAYTRSPAARTPMTLATHLSSTSCGPRPCG